MRAGLLFGLVLLGLSLPAKALAHQPALVDEGTPWVSPDPTVSWAVYGTFVRGNEVFELRLPFPRPFAAPFQMLVPNRSELVDHRPAYAIIGPGLPVPSAEELAALPRPLKAGEGAVVDLNRAPRKTYFESFVRRVYLTTGTTALRLPAAELTVLIWCPEKTQGKFGFAFGVEEGGFDAREILSHWSDYAW